MVSAINPKPLVIVASARRNSDTGAFVRAVFDRAEIEKIDLLDHEIAPYKYDHNYPVTDGFLAIAAQCLQHDVIVFATPVYWYAMSGQLKIFFDRLTDLTETHKPIGKALLGKRIAVLAIGTDPTAPQGFEIPFKLTAKYFGM